MHILVIDDNLESCELLSALFDLRGDNCEFENDGVQGLDNALINQYDVIILDLSMPKFSGYDFLSEFNKSKNFQTTKIIVYSAMTLNSEQQERLYKLGANEIIDKTARLERLESLLQ